MRFLGVDFGGKRIGLAVGELTAGLANARPNLVASGTLRRDAESIVRFAEKEEALEIVLGIPLDPEGEATSLAPIIRQLGTAIEAIGFKVHFVNEAMTTAESEEVMREAGLTAAERKARVDGEAACRILERFFAEWPKPVSAPALD